MRYRISQRLTPTHLTNITHRISATAYLIPLAILALLITSIAALSNKQHLFKPVAGVQNNVVIAAPSANTTETGTFQLRASVPGLSPSAYDMFWYVDNGQWNWMNPAAANDAHQADIDVSSWHWHQNDNTYTIVVVAVLHSDGQRAYSGVPIQIGSTSTQSTQTTTAANKTLAATPTSNALYVSPTSSASQTAANTSDPTMKRVMTKLASTPTAAWLGSWNANIQQTVSGIASQASAANQVPVLVAYNLPNRDCSGYSAGGASSPDAYKSWIQGLADGIGARRAVVILEPDSLAQISCLSPNDQTIRNQLLSFAVTKLKANAGTKVYLDAGNPSWIPAATMASRLSAADVAQADGFSLNVSNFIATKDNVSYGTDLSKLIGNKHFVIDTSRNGNGTNGEWCNPSGRAVGTAPTANTGNPLVDYLLWIKTPGESDGTCNGGPAAGVWWPTYAENLALNAGW